MRLKSDAAPLVLSGLLALLPGSVAQQPNWCICRKSGAPTSGARHGGTVQNFPSVGEQHRVPPD